MFLFGKNRFYIVPEPVRGVCLAGYLKWKGKNCSFSSPEFWKGKDGIKVPLFPLFIPSRNERNLTFSRISLDGIIKECISGNYSGYVNIAIGEKTRIRGYEEREIFLSEVRREFGEGSFVEKCFLLSEEMRNLYLKGEKEKAREKWEGMKEWFGKLNEEERGTIRTIFCSWTFVTHRFEQKAPADGVYGFLAGLPSLRLIADPEKLWSRLLTISSFFQLKMPAPVQFLLPSLLPQEEKKLTIRKKVWYLRTPGDAIPQEMENPVVYSPSPKGNVYYIEKLPITPEGKKSFIIFSHPEARAEEIKEILKTLAPLLDDKGIEEILEMGEADFLLLSSDAVPGKYFPLLPPFPSHITSDILDMERSIER